LLEAGLPPTCPVLAVQAATLPNQTIVSGTLADLAEGKQVAEAGVPFILMVGEVAALNPSFASQRPLHGRSIILTHPMTSPPDILRERLPLCGAQVLDCPSIQIAPPGDLEPLREAILRISDYGWILFTSKNAVDAVLGLLKEMRLDARKFGTCRIAAIGSATSRRLEESGLYPDLVPEEATGRGLAESLIAIGEASGRRFLFPASEIAREELVECLTAQGAIVDRVTAYRTMTFQGDWPDFEKTHRVRVDGICFASPSAVRGFRERIGEEPFLQLVQSAAIFSIGPATTAALRTSGVEQINEAATPGFEEMLEAILRVFGR
jgi:uroporphyrinogen III methyltransferase/synthase